MGSYFPAVLLVFGAVVNGILILGADGVVMGTRVSCVCSIYIYWVSSMLISPVPCDV